MVVQNPIDQIQWYFCSACSVSLFLVVNIKFISKYNIFETQHNNTLQNNNNNKKPIPKKRKDPPTTNKQTNKNSPQKQQ